VQPENMRQSNTEHAAILRAIAAGDPNAARAAGEAHIAGGKRRFQTTNASTPPKAAGTSTPRKAATKGENGHDSTAPPQPARRQRTGARAG
jgi:hypothetical protein